MKSWITSCGLTVLASCLATRLTFAVEFEAGFLRPGTSLDLQRYENDQSVPETEVTLDITLNQRWLGRHSVLLRRQALNLQASPCYSASLLQALGVDRGQLPAGAVEALADTSACLSLPALQLSASEDLNFAELRLHLEVAQQALLRQPHGYLPPSTWESGVTAGFIDYRLNLFQQQDLQQHSSSRQGYLGVRAGVNTGAWYWRHEGSWQATSDGRSHYLPAASWVRRDIPSWSAQFTAGDGHSAGDVFETSAFRGLQVSSDERMLPQSMRGFAPVVRGVANSTALLSIRQGGVLLHESTVPSGPFEIEDMYASGINQDLQVSLREADGSVRSFTIPYQAAPLALRPGAHRFELNGGVWRDGQGDTGPGFVQGSWQQGLNNQLSVHGGGWLSDDYLASAVGAAINSHFGAFGLTAYLSRSAPHPGPTLQGQALRWSWRHRFESSATDLGLSLTQTDSAGYQTFNDFAFARADGRSDQARWRASASLNQDLGPGGGRLNFSAISSQRWLGQGTTTGYNLGYHNAYREMGYGLNLSREQRADGLAVNSLTFTVSAPLGERRSGSISSGLSLDSEGQSSASLRWSATVGEDDQWRYGLAAVRQGGVDNATGLDADLLRRSAAGELSGSLASRPGHRQAALGIRGALVAHAGGVIAAPALGESFAIVRAPGAASARIAQHPYIRLDSRGYAVTPALTPYSVNTVELDPRGMTDQVELQLTAQSLVPRAGAVGYLEFATRSGRPWILEARREYGQALPFGAQVTDVHGTELGLVGQGSRLHLRSDDQQATLDVTWGSAAGQRCRIEQRTEVPAQALVAVCLAHPEDQA
ncbi:fimbria/pilus outer membrane usher protein [Pseudomonas shirazensis]|uniref:Fimbria/pilus outer membrane usher protein n=1 Tax=Pseudomonas shirazensis TaxID=2745494 RepID=A0ABU8ZW15_9PSED